MNRVKLEQPVSHLLVDLDGTLLGNRNIPLSIDFVTHAIKILKPYGGWRKAARALFAVQGQFGKPSKDVTNDHRVVGAFAKKLTITLEESRKILKEGVSVIFPSLERYFYPVPGSKDFLDWAKERFPLTLATNPVWPQEIIEMRVKWAGIDPKIFSYITSVTQMHACKPHQEYYEEILEQRNLKASECLLIGDNVKMDLPATKAGIRVFIVGPYKKLTPLKYPKAKAVAWRGSFEHLKNLLSE